MTHDDPQQPPSVLEGLAEQLDEMTLHDETGNPPDEGYMAAVRELRDWLTQREREA